MAADALSLSGRRQIDSNSRLPAPEATLLMPVITTAVAFTLQGKPLPGVQKDRATLNKVPEGGWIRPGRAAPEPLRGLYLFNSF